MYKSVVHTELGVIEYRSVGKGMPVLFLHGGHSNCYEHVGLKGFDPSKYQLIIPSRPGYGNTPLANFKSPEQAAELIASLIDLLDLKSVIVYGVSAGGLTALALASRHQEKIDKLVLASAVTKKWLSKDGEVYKKGKIIFHPLVESYVWGILRFFSKVLPQLLASKFYPQFSKMVTHPILKKDTDDLVSALRFYRSKTGFVNDIDQDLSQILIRQISCPTLIVHSHNDNSVPFEHAVYANQLIKGSNLIGLDNEWGHMIWLGEDSKYAISQIVNFIENE